MSDYDPDFYRKDVNNRAFLLWLLRIVLLLAGLAVWAYFK